MRNCTVEQFNKKKRHANLNGEVIRHVKLASYAPNRARVSIAERFWACLIAFCWIIQSSLAQQKPDQLLVYGDDFIFGIKEPPGWKGDTASAGNFQSNVILHETGQPFKSVQGLIRIRVNDKVDENTSADLEEDARGYRAQYPKVQFKDLSVRNARYSCLAKVFFVPGVSYEYVAYVNPGAGKPFVFSVSMNSQKMEASGKEIEAYKSVVESLTLLKP